MRTGFVLLISSLLLVSASVGSAQEREWKLIMDKDGIQVYRAHTDDSPIKTFRGETDVQLEDFRSLGPIMDDYDFVASWLHMISGIEGIARPSPYDRTVWLTTRLPWPVSDRDAALHVTLEQNIDTYTVRMPFTIDPDVLPEKSGFVRIPRMQGYLEFIPVAPGKIHLTVEVVLDPGGYLPAWLANLILRDIPYFSLKRFRNVANTKIYQDRDLGYYAIPPGWPSEVNATDSPDPAVPK